MTATPTSWTPRQTRAAILFVGSYIVFYATLAGVALFAAIWVARFRAIVAILAVVLVALALAPLMTALRRYAHRRMLDDRAQVMNDARGVVLYLRSFQSERAFLKPFPFRWRPSHERYLKLPDEHIALLVASLGRFVALASREETLPLPGALRIRSQQNWREDVDRLISRSALVVIDLATLTEGVKEEITLLMKNRDARCVIGIFGSSSTEAGVLRAEYERIRADVARHCAKVVSASAEPVRPIVMPEYCKDIRCVTFRRDEEHMVWQGTAVTGFDVPIRSDLALLAESDSAFLKPAGLPIDDFHLSFVTALERMFPEFAPAAEGGLPRDLQITRVAEATAAPLGQLGLVVALCWVQYGNPIAALERWMRHLLS